jgi:hypothetical protein
MLDQLTGVMILAGLLPISSATFQPPVGGAQGWFPAGVPSTGLTQPTQEMYATGLMAPRAYGWG